MASKQITLNADGTTTIVDATLLAPITNAANPNVTYTGFAKYTLPLVTGLGAAAYSNKRHSGSFLNFGGNKAISF